MSETRESTQQIWEETLRALGKRPARPSFESSIKQVRPKAITETTCELLVASAFARDYLEKRGSKAIETALEQVLGRAVTVRFELAQMDLDLEAPPKKRTPRPAARGRQPDGAGGTGR